MTCNPALCLGSCDAAVLFSLRYRDIGFVVALRWSSSIFSDHTGEIFGNGRPNGGRPPDPNSIWSVRRSASVRKASRAIFDQLSLRQAP